MATPKIPGRHLEKIEAYATKIRGCESLHPTATAKERAWFEIHYPRALTLTDPDQIEKVQDQLRALMCKLLTNVVSLSIPYRRVAEACGVTDSTISQYIVRYRRTMSHRNSHPNAPKHEWE